MKYKCSYCGEQKELGEKCPGCASYEVVVEHGDLPCGILCLTNITMRQWDEVMDMYTREKGLHDRGWRGVIVLHGLDPGNETKATYTEIP